MADDRICYCIHYRICYRIRYHIRYRIRYRICYPVMAFLTHGVAHRFVGAELTFERRYQVSLPSPFPLI